jgi:hypothetical protein
MISIQEENIMSCTALDRVTNQSGTVTSIDGNGKCILDWELDAVRAVSCIVSPVTGDYVQYVETANGRYIVNILHRTVTSEICLSGPDNNELLLQTKRLKIFSATSVNIASRDDVTISSVAGAIILTAQNFFQTIADSVIKLARNYILKAVQISTDAEQINRTHGCHQIITADKDIRIDGERINMG